MNNLEDIGTLEFRVALLERAFTSANTQIRELTTTLAKVTNLSPKDDAAPQALSVNPDSIAPFSAGFYSREGDPEGRAFRWTGPGDHFEFRLGLNRNLPWSFVMEVASNEHLHASRLRAFVDYVEVPTQVDPAGAFVHGEIPVREFGTVATLTFFMPNTFRPSQTEPGSKDSRSLGLVFYHLRLDPALASGVETANGSALPVNGANGADGHVRPGT